MRLMYFLDLAGTAVFAVTGALAAGRKQLDVFGVVVLGCVTALGGGTLRDVILRNHPAFWIGDPVYLAVPMVAAIGTFALVRRRRLPVPALTYADAAGLAIFTVIGFQKGLQATDSYGIAMVMGVMTGVVGGMIRDVLTGEVPLILRREIYASASLGGAALLACLLYVRMSEPLAVIAAATTTLAIRLAALRWNLALPIFRLEEAATSGDGGEPSEGGASNGEHKP
jgi:uncharacterized membrane protein YeiH